MIWDLTGTQGGFRHSWASEHSRLGSFPWYASLEIFGQQRHLGRKMDINQVAKWDQVHMRLLSHISCKKTCQNENKHT